MKVLNKGLSITEVIIGTGELWTPYRDLRDVVEKALVDASPESMDEVQQMLAVHKPDFISLLSSRGPNPTDRQELRKAGGEGAFFKGHEGKQVLPVQLINEAILLSDMFCINEFLALDLLATAETEMDKHPGWGRGLLAVYLYYEGRNAVVQSLLTIVQALPGASWNSTIPTKVVDLFQGVFDSVFTGDMMDRLLNNIEKTSEKNTMELLDANLALGDWRHRSEISKFIHSIRGGLAQIVFCWAAQHPVPWKDTLRLLDYLKTHVTTQPEAIVEIDDILLFSSILFCVNNSITLTEVDETFVKGFKKYIKDNENTTGFQCVEILDFYKLIFYTKAYKVLSETHMNTSRGRAGVLSETKTTLLKSDDDFDLMSDVFFFLKKYIFKHPARFSTEENLMRQFHALFVEFIAFMPLKLKELKNRSEDAAKTASLYYEQGIHRPPNLPQEYENFLECIGLFYSHDIWELAADYFSPDPHMAPLTKFVRSACTDTNSLFISNAKMLTGLGSGCPAGVFNILKQGGHNMCVEHFFKSMMKYLSSFGIDLNYDGPPIQRFEMNPTKLAISPAETNSICAYLDLIETLASRSEAIKLYFCGSNFQCVRMCFYMGKIRTVPNEVRARMLRTAAAMIPTEPVSPEIITNLWDLFYKTRLVEQGPGDLRTELEDRETRDTAYPLTIAMLKLMKALTDVRFPQMEYNSLENDIRVIFDNGAFDPYIAYLCDSILLKACHRSYKNVMDRWTISTLAVNIVSTLLDVVSSFMFQLLCDSPLLKSCLQILHDCNRVREMSTGDIPHVDQCSWQCLNLIQRVLQRQSWFLHNRDTMPNRQAAVLLGLHELLAKTISHSGRPEYLLTIVKLVDRLNPEAHRHVALEIIERLVTQSSETDAHLYNAILNDHNTAVIFRHTLTQLLYDVKADDNLKATILQLIRTSVVHPSPNLALFLIGVDKKIEFQNPGVQNHPITVLHALMDNCAALQDAFATILVLIREPLLWNPLLKYLHNNQFFTKILAAKFPNPSTTLENIGQFLKVMAVELKNSHQGSSIALKFLERRNTKFQDILSRFDVDNQTIEMPLLEFFEPSHISRAIQSCEVYDFESKIQIIRVEMLESLLREQIRELEKNVIIRLRKSINMEAKEITMFARQLNAMRLTESSKMLAFDGWRQCLEVIVLSAAILPTVGMDFVTSMLRVLLIKITSSTSPSKYFIRLSAETSLTLCAVISKMKTGVSPTTMYVILNHICGWISSEQSPSVRALLYSCVLYLITMFKDEGVASFSSSLCPIMSTLCRDSFQPAEVGRMQSMNLIGEILRLIYTKGLESQDASHRYKSAVNASISQTSMLNNESKVSLETSSHDLLSRTITTGDFSSQARLADNSFSVPLETKSIPSVLQMPDHKAAPYSQTTILNNILVKGYMKKLVEDLSLVDDVNLVQLFSSQPEKIHMRALYAFEAKMGLLCRLSATGSRATMMLLDVNIIQKLTDMNVFALNCIQEIGFQNIRRNPTDDSLNFFVDASQLQIPVGISQTDTLFSAVFKLFHVMLSAAPKNRILITQIWNFMTTHDIAIGSILSSKTIQDNSETVSISLLTSLMAKISHKLPAAAVNRRQLLYTKMLDILRLYAEDNTHSEYKSRIARHIMTFLCGHARNKEAAKEELSTRPCRLVLLPSTLHSQPKKPQDELSYGVILKIINNVTTRISASAHNPSSSKVVANMGTIIECGLTLIYFHMEIFLADNVVHFNAFDHENKKVKQELITKTENTAKQIAEISKLLPESDFVETLLLRLRRLSLA